MRPGLLLFPLLSGCALFTLAATKRSHPPLEGELTGERAREPVVIRRDAHGVPHVDARSEWGAWYGLGYAHGQDRLMQADLSRRLAHGRVSEWFGERAVELDVFVGSLDLAGRGARALADASPETRAMIEAYTAGINDGAASLKVLPVEYRLLGVGFVPWRAVDTTAVIFLQAWSLQENLDHEIASIALRRLPTETLDALLRTHPETPPIDSTWDGMRDLDLGAYTAPFRGFTEALGGSPRHAEASNNWVVGGGRTASGKPILANDPHLVQRVPSVWYAAHVRGGGLDVAGVTLPGSPGFPVGHNGRVAWGLTNVMADMVDLAVVPRDGERLRLPGGSAPPEVREVEVFPRGGEPVVGRVDWTPLGPVVNEGGDAALVLRWVGLEVVDHTHDLLRAMATAPDVATLRDALARHATITPQNVALADVDGAWGWAVAGAIPRRVAHTGRVPYPVGQSDWDGWIDDLPGAFEPDEGFVVTANSRPDHPNADAIATAYLAPHRHDRIRERLASLDAATPEQMRALQLDVRENSAARHRDRLLAGATPSTVGATCLAMLRDWDLEAGVDSAGAAVWAVFLDELQRGALAPVVGDDLPMLLDLYSTGRNALDGDFDRFLTDREARVGAALDRTCSRLADQLGRPERWSWGGLHALKLRHPFGAQNRLLSGWNLPEHPYPGTGATVAAAEYDATSEDWKVGFMASLRIVMPLDDLGASTLVHPGGQSGQPRSPYYATHFDAFVEERALPLWFDDADIAANTVHTLRIAPR